MRPFGVGGRKTVAGFGREQDGGRGACEGPIETGHGPACGSQFFVLFKQVKGTRLALFCVSMNAIRRREKVVFQNILGEEKTTLPSLGNSGSPG